MHVESQNKKEHVISIGVYMPPAVLSEWSILPVFWPLYILDAKV